MTLRLSALFENKVDDLLMNFYRDRSSSGRRTRQRSRRAVEDTPGTSGISQETRVTRYSANPRASTRASTSRQRECVDGRGTSKERLKIKISLTTGSVSTSSGHGAEVDNRDLEGTSSQVLCDGANDSVGQRTRTRSSTRGLFRDSVSSTSSVATEAPVLKNENGPSRYSTRLRVPPTRLNLNGASVDDHSEDDNEESSEEEEESESSEEEESDVSSDHHHRSNRSGKMPANAKKTAKNSNRKGKQVTKSRRTLRTRTVSLRYDDSCSESEGESQNQQLDVSSRGRVRKKAFKMVDYVN